MNTWESIDELRNNGDVDNLLPYDLITLLDTLKMAGLIDDTFIIIDYGDLSSTRLGDYKNTTDAVNDYFHDLDNPRIRLVG